MKRHTTDLFSLSAGVLFAALAVGFAADALDEWDLDVRWIPAVVLIVLGLGSAAASPLQRDPTPELASTTVVRPTVSDASSDQPTTSADAVASNTSPPSGEASTSTVSPSR